MHLLREDLQDEGRAEGAHEEEGTQEDQPQERGLRQVIFVLLFRGFLSLVLWLLSRKRNSEKRSITTY